MVYDFKGLVNVLIANGSEIRRPKLLEFGQRISAVLLCKCNECEFTILAIGSADWLLSRIGEVKSMLRNYIA